MRALERKQSPIYSHSCWQTLIVINPVLNPINHLVWTDWTNSWHLSNPAGNVKRGPVVTDHSCLLLCWGQFGARPTGTIVFQESVYIVGHYCGTFLHLSLSVFLSPSLSLSLTEIWNALPSAVVEASSLNVFKRMLDSVDLTKYCLF